MTTAEKCSHFSPGFPREDNSMEILCIWVQSFLPSKRDGTNESSEMTKDTTAGKGQAGHNDVTSNQMTGKKRIRQSSI